MTKPNETVYHAVQISREDMEALKVIAEYLQRGGYLKFLGHLVVRRITDQVETPKP